MKAPKFIVEVRSDYGADPVQIKAFIESVLKAEFGQNLVTVKVVNAAAVQKLASEWS